MFLIYCRFYSHVEGHHPAVLMIKTEDEEVTLDNITDTGINVLFLF